MTFEQEELFKLSREEAVEFYQDVVGHGDIEEIRWLGRHDRYFLLGVLMDREDILGIVPAGADALVREAALRKAEWCFQRCREVERQSEGILDLWSRFHYKSTIKTLGGSVQEIIIDPESTIAILSYNKQIANKFVDQVRRALESDKLKKVYPDILWDKPPRLNWSTQTGLIVRRKTNPKEPTLSGSGLVDGQPIGAHYALRIYDDVVVPGSVTTPEQIQKTTEAWELSLALGTDDGGRAWYAGTRYHPDDTYSEILKRGALKERRRICQDNQGRAIMMTDEAMDKLRRDMGAATWSAQMLQNPVSAGTRAFDENDLMYYDQLPRRDTMNVYGFIDSAKAKKQHSDYTTMMILGYGWDNNYYLLDLVNDRMNLTERTSELFRLHRQWNPLAVFWEQVGMACDVEHVKEKQERESYRFTLHELPRSGPGSNKHDRIMSLQPIGEQHRLWIPRKLKKVCADGEVRDMVEVFVTQWKNYPIVKHDDILDPLADVNDAFVRAKTAWPKPQERQKDSEEAFSNTSWDPFA